MEKKGDGRSMNISLGLKYDIKACSLLQSTTENKHNNKTVNQKTFKQKKNVCMYDVTINLIIKK